VKLATITVAAVVALQLTGCAQGLRKAAAREGAGGDTMETLMPRAAQVDATKDTTTDTPRRLESLTWNSVTHELTWDVSKGKKDGDDYQPQATDHYAIDMDNATMTFNGKTRKFSTEEASNVGTLMDLISQYAVESTIWWEQGKGDPLGPGGKPTGSETYGPDRNAAPVKPNKRAPTEQIAAMRMALERMTAAVMTLSVR
jgi:hypothetical protein